MKWRVMCACSDISIGNQCPPLNESAVVDGLSHSGRYLLDCCSDAWGSYRLTTTLHSPLRVSTFLCSFI